MKKIYLFILAIFSGILSVKSQSAIQATNTSGMGEILSNNAIIYKNTTANGTSAHDIEIKNVSAGTLTFIVQRFDDLLNTVVAGSDQAAALFCTDLNCFPPTTYTASVVLGPNTSFTLKADLNEASVVGESSIRYKIYDQNNPTDEFNVNLKYNSPMAVKNNVSLFSNVSNIYPNPSASNAYLNLTTPVSFSNVKVSIFNALGTIVSVRSIELNQGKNTISLDTENLPAGVYLVNLTEGSSKITKKITISK